MTTIAWTTFAIRLLVGFFLAVGIGIERQWLKTRAVLKTNVLVTLGSAMFVMLSIMTPGDASPTRISAQIVSGVGFLGGGVILREGASVKGINTAATLWCAAAIGTLVGSGFLVQAYVSTVMVVGANLLLRPLVEAFKQREDTVISSEDEEYREPSVLPEIKPVGSSSDRQQWTVPARYECHLTCSAESEIKVLELIDNYAIQKQLVVVDFKSSSVNNPDLDKAIAVRANFVAKNPEAELVNYTDIIGKIKREVEVSSVSWQLKSVESLNF